MKIGKLVISIIVLCALMMSLASGCNLGRNDFDYIEESGQITIMGYQDWVLYNTAKIPSVIDGKSVTKIGHLSNPRISKIIIPDSVTFIGASAFDGCCWLMGVTIPDSVMSIGVEAFYYCHSLRRVIIPDSVTSIDRLAFQNCENVVIHSRKDSYAHSYAAYNEIEYVLED